MKHYTGSDLGEDFRSFFRGEKKRLTAALAKLGCTNVEMSRQFYYFYGFFTSPTGQTYYFSSSDVRFGGYKDLLYRTAKDRNDWTGGQNQWVNKDEISKMKLI